ncbi:MAG: class I SAM-dependent methyltransferase [Chloroflexota bacterium]|nr:class I SAM-dependent methyltransferase [Chloroflexota bacterium]
MYPYNDHLEAFDHFAESVRHFAARELDAALESARRAHAAEPDELLYADAANWLERAREQEGAALYLDGEAFSAFIRGGSNLPLYDFARACLAEHLQRVQPASLLDIGTGKGTMIVPVTQPLKPIPRLTFCEPSIALLDQAIEFARDAGLQVESYPYPIEELLDRVDTDWDVAVATWSLQNLPPPTRADVFRSLARRVRCLFLAEFDDRSGCYPDLLDPARIRHVHDRYQLGLLEYPGQEGILVRHGFLIPIMYGYFARGEDHSTYEQPIKWWEDELMSAGFAIVDRTLLYPYWWADAYLLEAEAPGAGI